MVELKVVNIKNIKNINIKKITNEFVIFLPTF